MPDDISLSGWFLVVAALLAGFGIVRFGMGLLHDKLGRKAAEPSATHGTGPQDPPVQSRPQEQEKTSPQGDSAARDAAHWTEVLELAPGAPPEDIRRAYKRKMAQYHPDKVAALGPELKNVAERMTKRINRAYEEALRQQG